MGKDGLKKGDEGNLPPIVNMRQGDSGVPERDMYEALCRGERMMVSAYHSFIHSSTHSSIHSTERKGHSEVALLSEDGPSVPETGANQSGNPPSAADDRSDQECPVRI